MAKGEGRKGYPGLGRTCKPPSHVRSARVAMKRVAMEDAFDVFGSSDPSDEAAASPLVGLLRGFVTQHSAAICTSLRARSDEKLAVSLAAAAAALLEGDPLDCARPAAAVAGACWEALKTAGWPAACWREAYVIAQLLLCCVDTTTGDSASALSHLDRALVLGPSPARVRTADASVRAD